MPSSRSPPRRRPALGLGRRLLLLSLVVIPAARAFAPPAAAADTATVEGWMRRMSLEEKVAQMNHVPIRDILVDPEKDPTLDREKLRAFLRRIPVGLIANTIFDGGVKGGRSGWSLAEWRALIRGIQEVAHELGLPPVLHAIDHVHGANYILGGTIFPQQVNLAASFNAELARDWGRIMGKDTKAAGITQVFAPILDLQQQPLWSRTYETFGEDPYLTAVMGRQVIEGLQGPDPRFPDLPPVAGCMKHFIGYGNSRIGHDRAPVEATDRTLRNYYLPAYREAVRAGVKTAMSAYIEIDGVPMVSNRLYTIDLLRHELGWDGLLKPDYHELSNLYEWHMVTNTSREAARIALADTSIDQFTANTEVTHPEMVALVKEGVIPESRIDESVRRILQTKQWLGMLDDPLRDRVFDAPGLAESVGSEADRRFSLEVARESIVLLKNDDTGTLPIAHDKGILLTGKGCDSLSHQIGGWSLHWQGAADREFPYGTTIFQALSEARAAGTNNTNGSAPATIYLVDGESDEPGDGRYWHLAMQRAKSPEIDVIVACVGEGPYAEKPGDIDSLDVGKDQVELVRALKEAAGKPLVLVLVEGRTRLLQGLPDVANAVVHAMLPGPFGGQAVAEVLLGTANPSGRLPLTYPRKSGTSLHTYYGKVSEKCTDPKDGFTIVDCPVEWPFGHGLSYTRFAYSEPVLSAGTIDERGQLAVRVTVTNTGRVPGKEALLLFITDVARRVTPEAKLLRRFAKSPLLQPGESWTYETTLRPWEDLSYWGLAEGEDPLKSREVLESGLFYLAFGPEADCRAATDSGRRKGCVPFHLELSEAYDPACRAACKAWLRAAGKVAKLQEQQQDVGACPLARGLLGDVGSGDEERVLAECEARHCGQQEQQQPWDWAHVNCLEKYLHADRPCDMAARCGTAAASLESQQREGNGKRAVAAASASTTAATTTTGGWTLRLGSSSSSSSDDTASDGSKRKKDIEAKVKAATAAAAAAHQEQQQQQQRASSPPSSSSSSSSSNLSLSSSAVGLAFLCGMAAAILALVMAHLIHRRLGAAAGGRSGSSGSSSGGGGSDDLAGSMHSLQGPTHHRSSSVIRRV